MKVRITYRNEVFIEGKDLKEIKRIFDKINVEPEGSKFVEVSSVEEVGSYKDLKKEFERE